MYSSIAWAMLIGAYQLLRGSGASASTLRRVESFVFDDSDSAVSWAVRAWDDIEKTAATKRFRLPAWDVITEIAFRLSNGGKTNEQ